MKKRFCYQEGFPEPPATATLALSERIMTISVAPEKATIEIDSKVAGSREQELVIAFGP